jgi:hypothetical protein
MTLMKVLEAAPPPTLKEAQEAVGGLVELLNLPNGDQLLVNEEGLIYELALNPLASKYAGRYIVGPALLLKGEARWS